MFGEVVSSLKRTRLFQRVRRHGEQFVFDPEPGTHFYEYVFPETRVEIFGEGLGDRMIIRQFGAALTEYVREQGDPELGHVVIATGGYTPAFHPHDGDINVYWWWTFGDMEHSPEQFLEHYLSHASIETDLVLCASEQTQREAEQLGCDTLLFPLGTRSFHPLNVERNGMGFAGSRSYADGTGTGVHSEDGESRNKVDQIIGPFVDDPEFEWVSNLLWPEQLNAWYNSKLMTFGLHREGQRSWGILNNRVFETIASGTPFILEEHPGVESVLGFDYPYQTSSPSETRELVENIRTDPERHVERFREFSKQVREDHSYRVRVESLFDTLQ